MEIRGRQLAGRSAALVFILAAGFVMTTLTPLCAGDHRGRRNQYGIYTRSGDWPDDYVDPVSVSITRINGWAVAQGVINGQVAWRRQVAPAGNLGISISQGNGAAAVTIGPNTYVLDEFTGQMAGGGQAPDQPTDPGYNPGGPAPAPGPALPPMPIPPPPPPVAGALPTVQQSVDKASNHVVDVINYINTVRETGENYPGELDVADAALGAARTKLETVRSFAVIQTNGRTKVDPAPRVPASRPDTGGASNPATLIQAAPAGIGSAIGTSQPDNWLNCGDWSVDLAINGVDLSADQKDQLRPVFAAFAEDIKSARAADIARMKPVGEKIRAMRAAARSAGTMTDLASQDDYTGLVEEVGTMQADAAMGSARRNERIVAEAAKVLTPAQKRQFLARAGQGSADKNGVNQWRAEAQIETWIPNVDLSDKQHDQLMVTLVALLDAHDANKPAADEKDAAKRQQWWAARRQSIRDVIDNALTDGQKNQAVANRAARFKTIVTAQTAATVSALDGAGATAEQKSKGAELAAAAGAAMLKLGSDDPAGRGKLIGQLRDDIDKLLTAAQLDKLNSAQPSRK